MHAKRADKATFHVRSLLLCAFAAVLCAKAFVINPQLFAGKGSIPAESTDYVWTFVALALTGLFYLTYVRFSCRPRVAEMLCGLLFGVLNYFSTTLFAYDSWAFIGVFQSWPTVISKCIFQGATMATALALVGHALQAAPTPSDSLRTPRPLRRLRAFYAGRPTLAAMVLFIVCWSPYLVIFYPGTVISDMSWMFEQLQGITQMTTWHSVFTTWVFGGAISLGCLLGGGDNLGCFLYMLLQTAALAYACARAVTVVRRLGMRWRGQVSVLLFFAVVPIWGGYSMMIGKDTLHTATLLLLLVSTLEWARRLRVFRARQWLGYAALALLACLWRNNGAYVVVPSLLCFILIAKGRDRAWLGGILAGVLIAVTVLGSVIVPALGIVDNTASGIYSVPFQQTARIVRNHGKSLTAEEKAEIDRVLDVNTIGSVYQPWISDPVKLTYKQFGMGADIEKAALTRFRQTWLSLVRKYPVTSIQAFMAGNRGYYAFTPKYTGVTYSQQAGLRFVYTSFDIAGEGQLHTVQPAAFEGLRIKAAQAMEAFRTIPIVQMLFTCPLYTWLLVAAAIVLAHRRRFRDLALFAPALLSFAVCLVSPVDDYFRYFLPVIAMSIPLLACTRYAKGRECADDAA